MRRAISRNSDQTLGIQKTANQFLAKERKKGAIRRTNLNPKKTVLKPTAEDDVTKRKDELTRSAKEVTSPQMMIENELVDLSLSNLRKTLQKKAQRNSANNPLILDEKSESALEIHPMIQIAQLGPPNILNKKAKRIRSTAAKTPQIRDKKTESALEVYPQIRMDQSIPPRILKRKTRKFKKSTVAAVNPPKTLDKKAKRLKSILAAPLDPLMTNLTMILKRKIKRLKNTIAVTLDPLVSNLLMTLNMKTRRLKRTTAAITDHLMHRIPIKSLSHLLHPKATKILSHGLVLCLSLIRKKPSCRIEF